MRYNHFELQVLQSYVIAYIFSYVLGFSNFDLFVFNFFAIYFYLNLLIFSFFLLLYFLLFKFKTFEKLCASKIHQNSKNKLISYFTSIDSTNPPIWTLIKLQYNILSYSEVCQLKFSIYSKFIIECTQIVHKYIL